MNSKTVKISVYPYVGNFRTVAQIRHLVERKFQHLFLGVIIHGSVATNEVIKYSDFDGLLIVKDKFQNSKELRAFKRQSMKIICEFDPLQHHGWFQINENQLRNYPENYFPYVILEASKVIFPENSILNFELKINKALDYTQGLFELTDFLEKKVNKNPIPKNMYQLKSFLSEIMLLPCLYFAATNAEAILKGDSFKAVKSSFSENLWYPVTVASNIRNNWDYQINPIQRLIMTRPERLFRKLTEKAFAPNISKELRKELNTDFYESLKLLLKEMRSRVTQQIF